MPLEQDEGPLGLVVCPSRELARQTHAIIQTHVAALAADGWPELRCLLCVGGEDMRSAGDMIRRGVHMAVCTPGRLKDFLAKRKLSLDICRYLCLDEADRMVRAMRKKGVPVPVTLRRHTATCGAARLDHPLPPGRPPDQVHAARLSMRAQSGNRGGAEGVQVDTRNASRAPSSK